MQGAIINAYLRGWIMTQHRQAGLMAAVSLSRESVLKYLDSGVVVACENSPTNVTLSGDPERLQRVLATIIANNPDILVRRLRVSIAYHSRKFDVCFPEDLKDVTVLMQSYRSYERSRPMVRRTPPPTPSSGNSTITPFLHCTQCNQGHTRFDERLILASEPGVRGGLLPSYNGSSCKQSLA